MSLQSYYTSAAHSDYFGAPRGSGRTHRGDDFSHSRTPGSVEVPALLAGKVVSKAWPSGDHGFGHQITVESKWNGETIRISYAHGPWSSGFGVGDWVGQGQTVLYEGTSGATDGSCVHIEVYRGGRYVNPWPIILEIIGGDGGSGQNPNYSAQVEQQQAFLISRGADLGPTGADGIAGAYYEAAVKWYQGYLASRGWYSGEIDGKWGNGTQAGHEKFYAEIYAPQPAPEPWNPFGIAYCAGLQKIARLYGYTGEIDQVWGDGSAEGFTQFLRANWGYVGNNVLGPVMWAAIARWLRARWGYEGNDVPGPDMRAALQRAETANFNEL